MIIIHPTCFGYDHTIQAHVGSMGRVSSAIALCFSFSTPCIKYHKYQK